MRKILHKGFSLFTPRASEGSNVKGFTLIELLIVIAIIGVLAVGLLVALDPIEQTKKAADSNTLRTATEVRDAINRHYIATTCWPWQTLSSGSCANVSGCTDTTVYVLSASSGCGLTIKTALTNSGELKSYSSTLLSILIDTGASSSTQWKVIFQPTSKSVATNSVLKYTTTACSTLAGAGVDGICSAPGSSCQYCITQ